MLIESFESETSASNFESYEPIESESRIWNLNHHACHHADRHQGLLQKTQSKKSRARRRDRPASSEMVETSFYFLTDVQRGRREPVENQCNVEPLDEAINKRIQQQ